MKIFKILLKLTKYLLLVFLLLTVVLTFVFLNYTFKLEIELPTNQNIEIYDKNDKLIITLNNQNKQSYVSIDEISENVKNAIISIEDKKFYQHKGIDITRIGAAFINNIQKKELSQGASTITQQYAKLLYLSSEKTYKRKIEEIMIAINLESKYSKDQILEGYLNTIYFDHGIYGINDAALYYFNKTASELTIAEACVLCAIPKGPAIYSPIKNYENNKERKELILKEMYEDEKIDNVQYTTALEEKIVFYGYIDKTNPYYAPYYQDLIISKLKKLNIDKTQDLIIKTSLDLDLNQIIIDKINKYYPDNSDIELAIVAMDPTTGEVLSVIGGKNYETSTYNRATSSLRQPGSTIKPFLYYCALKNGFTPITTFYSGETTFNINGIEYSPSNYLDIYPNQDVSLAYALATSDNIYAVKTHLFLGTDVLYNFLTSLDFTSTINNNVSLALGTSEVYFNELIKAYSVLASLGNNNKAIYIKQITNKANEILYKDENNNEQILDKTTCYILAQTMTNIFDNNLAISINVTGARISSMISKTYAAKSGSTDSDNIMIGYNKKIVLGIWCGYDDNRDINNDGKFIKYLWAEIIEEYLKNYSNKECWYDIPDDVIAINVNPITGTIPSSNAYSKKLFFNINNIPWYIFEQNNEDDEYNEDDFNFYTN